MRWWENGHLFLSLTRVVVSLVDYGNIKSSALVVVIMVVVADSQQRKEREDLPLDERE